MSFKVSDPADSTKASYSRPTLNIEELQKLMGKIAPYLKDPIKEFMIKEGFNPDNGDLLIIPDNPEYAMFKNMEHPNIRKSPYTTHPMLVKNKISQWSWVFETDPPEDEWSIGDEDHDEEETIDEDDDWESEEDHDESDIEEGQL